MDELNEIQVSYKFSSTCRNKITSPDKAFEIILNSWDKNTIELQEEFKVLLLNRANIVLGVYPLSKGGVAGTVVDVKLIFGVALKCNASGIILCHNHPSGNLKPSKQDIEITKKIKQCSELFEISLLDHLIISNFGYYSFSEEGNLM